MLMRIVSLFTALLAVLAASSPVLSMGDDKAIDRPSETTDYQSLISKRNSGGYRVEVDLSGQILTLEIPERIDRPLGAGGDGKLYPTPLGIGAPDKKGAPQQGRAATPQKLDFVSASLLSAKAKQFDDGLYAAVEVALQEGLPGLIGKKKFMSALLEALGNLSDAAVTQHQRESSRALILAASSLGGQQLSDDAKVAGLSQRIKKDFLSDPLLSKPVGFYTWNSELSRIFQQDRLLQTKLDSPAAFALAIREKAGQVKDFYFKYLKLIERMTNPFSPDFTDLRPLVENSRWTHSGKTAVLFPPSRSYETDLGKKLYGQKPVPQNFNLAEKLIEEIKAGRINLTPGQNSGWYDYQTFSLESLILPEKSPEGKKLEFAKSYKKELEEFFKSCLALTRETHIKQLESRRLGAAFSRLIRINIYPDLTLEPLATYYLRRARSYNFIHGVLKEAFGEQELSKIYRLTASGPVGKDLLSELKEMEALFFGAALIVANETGCALQIADSDGSGNGGKKDVEFARQWIKHVNEDTDVAADIRMMVPVFYDVQRKMTKVWVVLGYQKKFFKAKFKSNPKIRVFDSKGQQIDESKLDIPFGDQISSLWYPVFEEIYVKNILDRDTFRQLCDRYATKSEILKALQQ